MGTTLLLADDSITIQKVVGIIFANEDYKLVVVDNGVAALEKAKESRPDVMLVDALMPGKNGYEVCEEVRRDPGLRDVPLLLLVGAFEPFDEERARNSGADAHITKPFESQNLIDKVKELAELGRSRVSAALSEAEQIPAGATAAVPQAGAASTEAFAMQVEAGQAPPETFAAAQEPEVFQPADSPADLAASFRGFVHLGGNVTLPAAVEPDVAETTFESPKAAETESPKKVAAETEGVIFLSSVDIVEAGPEDDPWGTFAEEVTEGEPIQFGEVLDGEEQSGLAETVEEIEPFTLPDDDTSPAGFGTVSLTEATGTIEAAGIPAQEEISCTEPLPEPPVDAGFAAVESPSEQVLSGSISLGGEPPAAEAAQTWEPVVEPSPAAEPFASPGLDAEESDLQFATEEDYVPTAGFSAAPAEAPESAEGLIRDPAALPAGENLVTLSEEQLAAAISKISREVIERIAWEVVPDLAETIIIEEIRKIKEGLSR